MAANVDTRSSYLLFIPLLLIALIVDIVRLPEFIAPFRPDFPALLLIFFAVYDPRRIGIVLAWCCGLLVDLLMGAPLGQNALCIALQIYLIMTQFKRFGLFAKWQQMIVILIINMLGHVLGYWISHIAGNVNYNDNLFYPSIITALLWPAVFYAGIFMCKAMNIAPDLPKEN